MLRGWQSALFVAALLALFLFLATRKPVPPGTSNAVLDDHLAKEAYYRNLGYKGDLNTVGFGGVEIPLMSR